MTAESQGGYRESINHAWAAGFFDGEGTTSIRKSTRAAQGRGYRNGAQIRATIVQNDREVLDRFQQAVGVGVVYGPYDRKDRGDKKYNPYYMYQAHTYDAIRVIHNKLFGLLGSIKKAQMEKAISIWEDGHVGA